MWFKRLPWLFTSVENTFTIAEDLVQLQRLTPKETHLRGDAQSGV